MNKTVFITGASRGIGLAIAKKFAKEGYNIAITYSTSQEKMISLVEELATKYNVLVEGYQLNVEDEVKCMEVIQAVYEKFTNIDVLVNNAGITRDMLSMRMKKEDLTKVLDVNLVGSFNVSQLVIKKMSRNKKGSIINLSSVVGIRGNAGQVNYSASKAAIIGLTKSYAIEYGKKNIRVNAVAPGFIKTEMTDNLSDEIKNSVLDTVSLARFGEVEEVANVVYFLGSDESSYVTGQTIVVDGLMR